jgi:hypothetical protein
MQLTATVMVKAGLARLHQRSAERFASHCAEIARSEAALPWPQPRWEESHSFSSAAVLLAVAALEATANEFYLEAVDGNSEAMNRIGPKGRDLLSSLWDEVDEFSILKKYEIALLACAAPPFPRGQGSYQAAAALVDLRNALTHFKPEWNHELDRHAKLRERLRGRFEDCALAPPTGGMIWFPYACLGAGCAGWAVRTSRAFITEFCEKLKVAVRLEPSTYQNVVASREG